MARLPTSMPFRKAAEEGDQSSIGAKITHRPTAAAAQRASQRRALSESPPSTTRARPDRVWLAIRRPSSTPMTGDVATSHAPRAITVIWAQRCLAWASA